MVASLNRQAPESFPLLSQAAYVGMLLGAGTTVFRANFGGELFFPVCVTAACYAYLYHRSLPPPAGRDVINQQQRREVLSGIPTAIRRFLNQPSQPAVEPAWVEVVRWAPVSRYREPYRIAYVQVRALSNGTALKYEASNLKTGVKTSGPFQIQGTLSEAIQSLKNLQVTLEDNGSPVFSEAHHTFNYQPKTKTDKTQYVIPLLMRRADVVWNIYDFSDPNNIKAVVKKSCNLGKRCSFGSRRFLRTDTSLAEQIRQKQECVLAQFDPKTSKIHIEPLHSTSFFQDNILVSKYRWTVALIRNSGPTGNHAQIVVEGINDGFFSRRDHPR